MKPLQEGVVATTTFKENISVLGDLYMVRFNDELYAHQQVNSYFGIERKQ